MAKNINHIQHVKSNVVENNKPKLPTSDVLAEGELAVNFAKGFETISIKNASGEIVTFSSDNYFVEKKLGSGFTDANSAKTVTEAIEQIADDLSEKMVSVITSSNNSIATSSTTLSDGTKSVNVTTDASKITGLTAVADSDEGAAKVSGVSVSDSVKSGIENLYKSLASEIAARKSAIVSRTITSTNGAITVSEVPNSDGFGTSITLKLDGVTNGSGSEGYGVDNALTITDNGLFISTTWECGNF